MDIQRCFDGCTRITAMPDLPATNLSKNAYDQMFAGCSNLKKTSNMKYAFTWNDTYSDYNTGWDSTTAPYRYMFDNCSSLDSIEVDFREWPKFNDRLGSTSFYNATLNWVTGVAASGQFICPYDLDTTLRDVSHIPTGWEIIYKDIPESTMSEITSLSAALTLNND